MCKAFLINCDLPLFAQPFLASCPKPLSVVTILLWPSTLVIYFFN